MRDVQVSIEDFYRSTTGFGVDAEVLATPAKNALSAIQALNDLLTNAFSQKQAYSDLFKPPFAPLAEVIQAFKYVRNVAQHVIHPVEPASNAVVGGLGLGYRTFSLWPVVPAAIHAQLHAATQALRPHYEAHLMGQEVVHSLLEAAQFFWQVCPDLVHRRADGEWTGFPLRHQAGVSARLHPEEPTDPNLATAWMAGRRPGGDLRVLCGSIDDPGGPILFGLTFMGRCALTPFFESPEQVSNDIAMGFAYHDADIGTHTRPTDAIRDRCGLFADVLCSEQSLDLWIGDALPAAPCRSAGTNYADLDFWRQLLSVERPPNSQWFLTRRERRLCAWFPIS
jgi:hypothetical protein